RAFGCASQGSGWVRSGLLLVGRPDHDQAAVGARDSSLDQDDVVLGVDANDGQVANRDALVAVAAGHASALLGSAAAAVAGQRADAAGRAVVLLDAVAGWQAGEVVPLHHACGAPA